MFRKKRPKQPKTLYKENLDCVQCQNQCMNPSVSVKNRSLRDSSRTRTRTRNGSMDACLSFTTVLIFTDTDTYTDHGHGSQFTDLWMASLTRMFNMIQPRKPSSNFIILSHFIFLVFFSIYLIFDLYII